MTDFSGLSDKDLKEVMTDPATSSGMPEKDKDDLQIEWCKRNRAQFVKPDGTIVYTPDDWPPNA